MIPRPDPEATMTFLEHLEELRRRLLWSLATLGAGAVAGFFLTARFGVIQFLSRPIRPLLEEGRLAYLHPTEPFMVTIKVGMFVGIVLALPVLFWHFWRFVTPGLLEREKRIFFPALFSSVALFVAGAALAFFYVLPLGLRFFFGFAEGALQPVITINEYFSFAIQVTLMFGLAFETPLVILVLTYVGVLSTRILRRYRRHAVVAIAILSAVLTPTADIVSMLAMFVPIYLLFEVSVILSGVIERRRRKRAGRLALETSDA